MGRTKRRETILRTVVEPVEIHSILAVRSLVLNVIQARITAKRIESILDQLVSNYTRISDKLNIHENGKAPLVNIVLFKPDSCDRKSLSSGRKSR